MKKEILYKLNRMFDDSGRAGCYYGDTDYDSLPVVYGYNLAIADAIKDIESIPDPEPLDPHTCELCVGDVVRINQTKDYGKHVVFSINNHSYSIISARTNKVRLLQRYQLFLESNQRAGVQIGESW